MHLYAFGSNGAGQLAIGHMEDVNTPARCLFVGDERPSPASGDRDSLSPSLMQLIAGGNHTLIRLACGRVYAAGSNLHGECATHASTQNLLRFQRVIIAEPLADVALARREVSTFSNISATWSASFFVDVNKDSIFVSGHGSKGELGLGPDVTERTLPTKIPNFPPVGSDVISIASGMAHTIVLLDDGTIYGWGAARKGQLGADKVSQKVVWSPQKIVVGGNLPGHIREISCGREFTVLTTTSSASLSYSGASSESLYILGPDKWALSSAAPSMVAPYKSLTASWHGVYVHLRDGTVLAWGRNDRGQLPTATMPALDYLAVGSEHVVGAIDHRTLIAFGWGEHGNCGPETDEQGNVAGHWNEVQLPIDNSSIEAVGAGMIPKQQVNQIDHVSISVSTVMEEK
ncbi:alpha-tubulin suppressor protein Aats1, putative [Trichophyton verrucosum HKI 0517]|uniref:Alpha-tubulin suppressor protein Aats1, putative n=1 Tax=Trichophyton verrucosum (strain HKI 0517) TaxID=663202 RepID=D4D3N9_TRIVH|nr:alpha-tubulin suppressor protein Aats1, putative [Trichophyton verrucosum HKI 0517]EFE43530.1 alpha-tubulin suppressor protein Aats1, putative [Trichophyton verrucosum HKI 0517]